MIDRRREPGLNVTDDSLESADALMRQADALLGRHRQSQPVLDSWLPDEDDDLPLLTDVVELDGEPALPAAQPSPASAPAVSPAEAWQMAMSASQAPAAPAAGLDFDLPDWPDPFGPHDTRSAAAPAPEPVIPAVTRRPPARELRADPPPWPTDGFGEVPPHTRPHDRAPAFELPDGPAPPAPVTPPPPAPAPTPAAATTNPASQPPAADTELLPPLEFSGSAAPDAAPAPPPPAAPPPIPLEALEARLIEWLASELPGLLQSELDMLSSRIERRLIERARSELLPALQAELKQPPGRSS